MARVYKSQTGWQCCRPKSRLRTCLRWLSPCRLWRHVLRRRVGERPARAFRTHASLNIERNPRLTAQRPFRQVASDELPQLIHSPVRRRHVFVKTASRRQRDDVDKRIGSIFDRSFFRQLTTVTQAHNILDEERGAGERIRAEYYSIKNQFPKVLDSIDQAIAENISESSARLLHLRATEQDQRRKAADLGATIEQARGNLTRGVKVAANFEVELRRQGRQCLEAAGLLGRDVDAEALRRELFEAPLQPEATEKVNAASEPATTQVKANDERAIAKSMIDAERRAALKAVAETEQRLETHRENYSQNRLLHIFGERPGGLDEWSASWSDTEFDVRHLHQSMKISRQIAEAQDRLEVVMQWVRDSGVEPLAGQRLYFADRASDGYVQARAAGGGPGPAVKPDWRIERWQEGMPLDPAHPEELASAPSSDDVSFVGVDIGDSESCRAKSGMRRVIRGAQYKPGSVDTQGEHDKQQSIAGNLEDNERREYY